jgi:purine-binding chemotaxis protein CheW
VTAIDLQTKLGFPDRSDGGEKMHVVIEHSGEPYGLVVDCVGDVMELASADWEPTPRNLDLRLAALSTGVYRLDGRLLVILDIPRMLASGDKQAA